MTDPTAGPSPAARAYQSAVSEIIDSRRASVPYPPGAPQLTVTGHHRPGSVADLAPAELTQLHAAWYVEGGPTLDEVLADEENQVEAAQVVDETGALRYRLYGWNFGVGYLFPPDGLEVVAFGAQHDIEHWSLAQRDLFAGMDRALRAGGHGFTQPLHFCWTNDTCWAELAPEQSSESYLRQSLARTPPPPAPR